MKRLRRAWQENLATKVITSTVLLSLGVVWLTGSALYSRLSDGIRSSSLNTSIAESRVAFFNAQYQMIISQGMTVQDRKDLLSQIVNTAVTVTANEATREVIILRSPAKVSTQASNYEISTGAVLTKSVPGDLRKQVQDSTDVKYSYGKLSYIKGRVVDALFVGTRVNIPSGGRYEMYLVFSLASQASTIHLVQNSLLATGGALLILIALITWLVVRQVVRPVREAARVATQYTHGDFSQRLQVESKDELAVLAHSYNEMAQSLETQITRLENLSRVQQRFVSDVSHELRTPLTTLRMASEVIYNQRKDFDPIVSRSSELLMAQLDRFEVLLEELLEVSRFDAEVAVLEVLEFDVIALINRCISDLGVSGDAEAPAIGLVTEKSAVTITGDMRRVERIMRNLLSNALDHCDGTPITIRVVATETEVAIGVRDFGTGLDEASLIRVFDRFWRADPSRARVRGGTGLGLSIALEDARLHNGELDAWGRPGQGAHFVLTLPRIAGGQIESRPLKAQPEDFHQENFYQ
jgi:two-component system sensor histidine kinase MtrB